MKSLITTLLISASITTFGCELNLVKTKVDAKTYYTSQGESISKATLEKLASQCKINARVMSAEEKLKFDIKRAEARVEKLKAKIK